MSLSKEILLILIIIFQLTLKGRDPSNRQPLIPNTTESTK